jgi:hypothetical protein
MSQLYYIVLEVNLAKNANWALLICQQLMQNDTQ